LRYNPILAEAWGRSIASKDTRAESSGWDELDVGIADYTNAAKNFKDSISAVISEATNQLTPAEKANMTEEQERVLERWKKEGFTYPSWKDPSTLVPFEKHHIMPKNTMPEGSLSGTNLVLLPKELHQMSATKAAKLGVSGMSSAHLVSSGTGDTKSIIRTRAALLLDRVNKEGSRLEKGRYA
jgi:hypothetical protein